MADFDGGGGDGLQDGESFDGQGASDFSDLQSVATGDLFIGPDGSLLKLTASGGDNGFLQLGAIGDLKELRIPGETGLGGSRIVDEMEDQNGNGGIPGIEMRPVTGQHNVALRPADGGRAAIWWDRADGSKEQAIIAESGQAETDDERAPVQILRNVDMRSGGAVRNETLAPDSATSRGTARFMDDFMGALDPRWSQVGSGTVTVGEKSLDGSGGVGMADFSTGASSDNEARLSFGDQTVFRPDTEWRLRMVFKGESDTDVTKLWGLKEPGTGRKVVFRYDDSVSANVLAVNSDTGSETTTDTGSAWGSGGEYVSEIHNDPYAGEINFKISDAQAKYPSIFSLSDNTVTHSTNLPADAAFLEPQISVTTNEAADKTWRVDYFWIDADRVPHSRDP